MLLVRHAYSADGLTGPHDATVENVLTYSRAQSIRQSKIPRYPPALWLNFVADGKRRSRFLAAYENRGEVRAERTDVLRYFDLHVSDVLVSLRDRLVIEWSNDTINWAKAGGKAGQMPVVEIAGSAWALSQEPPVDPTEATEAVRPRVGGSAPRVLGGSSGRCNTGPVEADGHGPGQGRGVRSTASTLATA